MKVRWVKTSREVYAAIYSEYRGEMQVHGTCTRLENSSIGDRLILTEWGLKGADAPIIRHEERGEEKEHSFFLACVLNDDE